MHRILLLVLALGITTATSAQSYKKKKQKAQTEQTDSSATKKEDNSATDNGDGKQQADTTKKEVKKKDYKKANQQDKKKSYQGKSKTGTVNATDTKTKTKPLTKKEQQEQAEREAAAPKGIELNYYTFPADYIPVVKEFMEVKQAESPHVRVKDDKTLRQQIIRYKNIDKGYMMLQKPGDSKYTKLQVFKKSNGNLIMAVEQSDCNNGVCQGTLNFYQASAKGWSDVTSDYYPTVDFKYVLSRLKTKYKKEYKDLDLYNSKGYEENENALHKAITYTIAPDEAKIVITEQYLPCPLYEMIWDGKKDKFELKKIEK